MKLKNKENFLIRKARLSDAAGILGVYKPFIESTPFTFETQIPNLGEIKKRISTNLKYGWLVCEENKRIVGYAYACRHRERAAYKWCCDISVYIDEKFHGRGIAGKLYEKLLSDLKLKGLVNIYAGITLPNKKSERFHFKQGFKLIGVYKKTGYKFKKWPDVGWYALRINSSKNPPRPIKF